MPQSRGVSFKVWIPHPTLHKGAPPNSLLHIFAGGHREEGSLPRENGRFRGQQQRPLVNLFFAFYAREEGSISFPLTALCGLDWKAFFFVYYTQFFD